MRVLIFAPTKEILQKFLPVQHRMELDGDPGFGKGVPYEEDVIFVVFSQEDNP